MGAAIGGLIALGGASAAAVIKHFSDLKQKRLERSWNLDDEERRLKQERARASFELHQRARNETDDLLRISVSLLSAVTTEQIETLLSEFDSFLVAHPHWLRNASVRLYAGKLPLFRIAVAAPTVSFEHLHENIKTATMSLDLRTDDDDVFVRPIDPDP